MNEILSMQRQSGLFFAVGLIFLIEESMWGEGYSSVVKATSWSPH